MSAAFIAASSINILHLIIRCGVHLQGSQSCWSFQPKLQNRHPPFQPPCRWPVTGALPLLPAMQVQSPILSRISILPKYPQCRFHWASSTILPRIPSPDRLSSTGSRRFSVMSKHIFHMQAAGYSRICISGPSPTCKHAYIPRRGLLNRLMLKIVSMYSEVTCPAFRYGSEDRPSTTADGLGYLGKASRWVKNSFLNKKF